MILVNNVSLSLDTDFDNLSGIAAKVLKTEIGNIKSAGLLRRSVDARHKNDVHFVCSLLVEAQNEQKLLRLKNVTQYTEKEYILPKNIKQFSNRPVVVGFGPAGMFCALTLAKMGLKPLCIERGNDVDTRSLDVDEFFKTGVLNTESNVQFGEGGAGTFSDGKLNTGIKDERCRYVLKEFVRFGAPEKILYEAKPHIGTDILKKIVKNIRNEIISLGGMVRFGAKLDGIKVVGGKLCGVSVNGTEIPTECLLLCCGHSARDTFGMLLESGVNMVQKPFSVGVRIEHLQSDINKALYGSFAEHPALGAADYKMAIHLKNGRGVYTFCMCPGGRVINSSSEENSFAVNGMSESARADVNSNSALLVGVEPDDFGSDDILAGCELQRRIEKAAYDIGGGAVPVDNVGHFVYKKEQKLGRVTPTVKPRYRLCDLQKIFPPFVSESLKEGIKEFGKKISGFDDCDAVLTAPETRSSSPVRILRDESGNSNIAGLYPCGEGAGYAGGIMSAAVDGIKTAEKAAAVK